MYVIELSGYTCSGKNTAGELLKRLYPNLNVQVLDMTAEVLIPEAVKRNVPLTRYALRSLYMEMGISAYERLHHMAVNTKADVLVTPNGRLVGTRDYFTALGDTYVRGWLNASEWTRFLRYIGRQKEGEGKITTVKELRRIDEEDSSLTDVHIIKSQKTFDFVVPNNSNSLGQLEHDLQEITQTILPVIAKVRI